MSELLLVVLGAALVISIGVGIYLAVQPAAHDLGQQVGTAAQPVLDGLKDATTLLKEEAAAVSSAVHGVQVMTIAVTVFVFLSMVAILALFRVVRSAVMRDLENNAEFRRMIQQIVRGTGKKRGRYG